jgi:hypothetical protein
MASKSPGAIRQKRYRDRKRNAAATSVTLENVTGVTLPREDSVARDAAAESVTQFVTRGEQHEAVTLVDNPELAANAGYDGPPLSDEEWALHDRALSELAFEEEPALPWRLSSEELIRVWRESGDFMEQTNTQPSGSPGTEANPNSQN